MHKLYTAVAHLWRAFPCLALLPTPRAPAHGWHTCPRAWRAYPRLAQSCLRLAHILQVHCLVQPCEPLDDRAYGRDPRSELAIQIGGVV